ncbi:MAG: signal peptidase I [Flavobacterium sp.]|nr:signal peptidase I [Flavobacterium sp.]
MTIAEWFVFFLILQVIHFAGTWKLYKEAGYQPWHALVPIYNAIILMKIINRSSWWTILLFVPVVNLIMFPVIWVETIRSFGRNSTKDTVLVLLTLGFYIYYVNYTQKVTHITDRSLVSKTKAGDTISSLLFAIVVATIVHTYVMQPFTIPTSSLEKTLLIGDFLFVSKFHYGARTPMTTVALPMVHDSIPLTKQKSYMKWPQLPYFRFPGFQKIEREDIVVFNWPVDTVYQFFDESGRHIDKPLDKRSNYVKRCVGTPGDTIFIKDGILKVNGKELILPERAKPQFYYTATFKESPSNDFFSTYDISDVMFVFEIDRKLWENKDVQEYLKIKRKQKEAYLIEQQKDSATVTITGNIARDSEVYIKLNIKRKESIFNINLTEEKVNAIKKDGRVLSVKRFINPPTSVFPKTEKNWSADNYGPLYIPQQGKTVALNIATLPLYSRLISVYEHHDLKVSGNEIRIDGKVATSYTFGQNYYWMMGDNRHNSEDSRFWGFVPEDHIVGKPVFLWMSWDTNGKGLNKIRWERLFTTVGGEGQPYSYFKFFLIAIAAYFGITFFLNKRREKADN